MKFEIADWRFEVTWDGLLCQPIERGRAKAAKKPAIRREKPGRVASETARQAAGFTVQSLGNNAQQKGATK
ncbi:MAG TPA: hypothetical protein VFY40_24670 [Blastocatellia bacterium]|nr:hypothetical protein [Blastocatellia bacterium]